MDSWQYINLIVDMCGKYSDKHEFGGRRDAQNAARVVAVVLQQFFDKSSVLYKQFELMLTDILEWNAKQKGKYEGEIEFYTQLQSKFQ